MTISEQVQKDMVAAMRSREELRLSVLRMVKTAITNKEKDKRAPLDDKEVQQILSTLIKQRLDSIEQFTKGGRQALADKEAAVGNLEPFPAVTPANREEQKHDNFAVPLRKGFFSRQTY